VRLKYAILDASPLPPRSAETANRNGGHHGRVIRARLGIGVSSERIMPSITKLLP
jgi:hypothetical protein